MSSIDLLQSTLVNALQLIDPLLIVRQHGRYLRQIMFPSTTVWEIWFGKDWFSVIRLDELSGKVSDIFMNHMPFRPLSSSPSPPPNSI